MSYCNKHASHLVGAGERCPACWMIEDIIRQRGRIKELEAEREWTSVKDGGMPDEEGWYLCAFSDGSVESFYIADDDIAEGGWSSMNISLTHWTASPAHPGGE